MAIYTNIIYGTQSISIATHTRATKYSGIEQHSPQLNALYDTEGMSNFTVFRTMYPVSPWRTAAFVIHTYPIVALTNSAPPLHWLDKRMWPIDNDNTLTPETHPPVHLVSCDYFPICHSNH